MSRFSISLSEDEVDYQGERVLKGRLVIGDFTEDFVSPTYYWTRNQYLEQWKSAITRILDGRPRSAIITSMRDPEIANFFFWWPLYLESQTVYIHNNILFLADLDEKFEESRPYDSISERRTVTEDGEPISEWTLPISAFTEHSIVAFKE